MGRKRQKLTSEKNDVQKECQDAKMTALERKLEHTENKLKLVTAELEQVKRERVRDKINFETENCQLKSEIDKYKEQCTELQNENERLRNYLQDLESKKINGEEKSPINLCNTDLNNQITKVNESDNDAFNINSLPDEIILEVFSYLNQNQLSQVARVCRRWSVLVKRPVFWKKVNVRFVPRRNQYTPVAESFINGLPSCASSIKLDFSKYKNWMGTLDYMKLCVILQGKCPDIKELILTDSVLSDSLPSVIDISSQFLRNVTKLIFHRCVFPDFSAREQFDGISKIEVLDLGWSKLGRFNKPQFSRMPNLKVLCLHHTSALFDSWFSGDASFLNQLHVLNVGFTCIYDCTFQVIQNHAHNLKELFICNKSVQDRDLTFNNSVFPHLKTICLEFCDVTCEGVVSLIRSCPSLENVYVDRRVAQSFAAHPFVLANRCKSGIVKAVSFIYEHNLGYLHN